MHAFVDGPRYDDGMMIPAAWYCECGLRVLGQEVRGIRANTLMAPGVPSPAERGLQPFRIYLAGGFHKDYKVLIQNALVDQVRPVGRFRLLDPEANGLGYGPGEFVDKDFAAIRSADLMLAYFDEYPYVYGVAAEIGYAVASGVPVILVMERNRVDSFLSGCARATFTKLNPALQFILDRYAKDEK